MISISLGRRVEFFLLFRKAGRSTTMKALDRSTVSYRAILFFLALFGIPRMAYSATLEESARELAGKIASALPAKNGVFVEVRNVSSLAASEAADVQQALSAELQNRGWSLVTNDASAVSVLATLSENLKGYVWSAEIRQGDVSRTVLLTLPKSPENQTAPRTKSLALHAEKFWEGPEPILDATVVWVAEGNHALVLLLPEGLLVRKIEDGSAIKIPLDSNQTMTRNPDGTFLNNLDPLSILLEPNLCTVALNPPAVQQCSPAPRLQLIDPIPGRGQVTGIRSMCGGGMQILASGAGDYSQSDTVQAFESDNGNAVPVTEELTFPGPVSLHGAATSSAPSAIVRNLRSGNYEAYHLSISCQR
jgi:hypothetical protein